MCNKTITQLTKYCWESFQFSYMANGWPNKDLLLLICLQGGAENVKKVVQHGNGTGELSFFFGLRHLGNIIHRRLHFINFILLNDSTNFNLKCSWCKGKSQNWSCLP